MTISFGLRNIVDPDAGLREMLRVTRPGGRLVVCEFSSPTFAPFRTVYIEYLMRALPPVARAVSSSPDAYVYLAESIRAWPDQPGLAARIARPAGRAAEWRNLSGGIVALHRARVAACLSSTGRPAALREWRNFRPSTRVGLAIRRPSGRSNRQRSVAKCAGQSRIRRGEGSRDVIRASMLSPVTSS